MKTAEDLKNLRQEFKTATGSEHWWTNPVCHGETAFASWVYQKWLEDELLKSRADQFRQPPPDIQKLKEDFFKKFGKQSFRGYPLSQCWDIWEFFLPAIQSDQFRQPEQPAPDKKLADLVGKLHRGCDCDHDYRCANCQAIADVKEYFGSMESKPEQPERTDSGEELPPNEVLDLMKRVNEAEKKAENHFNHLMEYMRVVEDIVGFAGPVERVMEELLKLKGGQ